MALLAVTATDKDKAKAHKKAGFAAAKQKNFETAIAEFEKAYAAYPHPSYLVNIAVIYGKWPNHCKESLEAFDRFFEACADCKQAKAGRKRQAKVAARCTTEITFIGTPADAKVTVDGNEEGLAPLTMPMIVGSHAVAITKDGHRPFRRTLDVVAGTPATVDYRLEVEGPTMLAFENIPAGTAVTVMGQTLSDQSTGQVEVPPGEHDVAVYSATGRHTIRRNVRRGSTVRIDVAAELPAPPPIERPDEGLDPLLWPFIGAVAVSAVATGVGMQLGSRASSQADDINNGMFHPATRAQMVDDANGTANAANVAYGVAGATAVVALAIWILPVFTGDGAPLLWPGGGEP